MKNKIFLPALTVLLNLSAPCHGQEAQYRFQDATQLWHQTDNAAGLGLDSLQNRGDALFNTERQCGDCATVQEGTQTHRLRFQTERYQTIGKYL